MYCPFVSSKMSFSCCLIVAQSARVFNSFMYCHYVFCKTPLCRIYVHTYVHNIFFKTHIMRLLDHIGRWNKENLNMKMTSKIKQSKKKDNLKTEDDLKHEDDLKNNSRLYLARAYTTLVVLVFLAGQSSECRWQADVSHKWKIGYRLINISLSGKFAVI